MRKLLQIITGKRLTGDKPTGGYTTVHPPNELGTITEKQWTEEYKVGRQYTQHKPVYFDLVPLNTIKQEVILNAQRAFKNKMSTY